MKIFKSVGVIFLLSIVILNYGCISCSNDGTSTNGNTIVDFYPPPEDCGNACLYNPYASYLRSSKKTTKEVINDSISLFIGTYFYDNNGWKDAIKVSIEGKNIDKYAPNCYPYRQCFTSKCESEQYGIASCTISNINLSDFSNQNTYTLKVLTNSYGEFKIDIPLSDVKFLLPVHIVSPFDSNTITDTSHLPQKVTLNKDSFTIVWDNIEGANYFNIQSVDLNLDEHFKQSGLTNYTFKNISPGIFIFRIIAKNVERMEKNHSFDSSELTIEVEAQ